MRLVIKTIDCLVRPLRLQRIPCSLTIEQRLERARLQPCPWNLLMAWGFRACVRTPRFQKRWKPRPLGRRARLSSGPPASAGVAVAGVIEALRKGTLFLKTFFSVRASARAGG